MFDDKNTNLEYFFYMNMYMTRFISLVDLYRTA